MKPFFEKHSNKLLITTFILPFSIISSFIGLMIIDMGAAIVAGVFPPEYELSLQMTKTIAKYIIGLGRLELVFMSTGLIYSIYCEIVEFFINKHFNKRKKHK